MKLFLPVALLLASSNLVFAQGPAASQKFNVAEAIALVKQPYVAGKQKLEADFGKLLAVYQTSYLAALEKLQADTAKTGDLDAVLLIKAERERSVARTNSTPQQLATLPAAAKVVRANYEVSLKKLTEDGVRLDGELRAKCVSELETLQKRVTMADRIVEALEIKKEKERFAQEKAGVGPRMLTITQGVAAPVATGSAPKTVDENGERWERRLGKQEDLTGTDGLIFVDGWFAVKERSGNLGQATEIKNGAVRGEFRWTPGATKELSLRIKRKGQGYSVRRDQRGIELRQDDSDGGTYKATPLARFDVQPPNVFDVFQLELRVVGRTISVKLDGKTVITYSDDKWVRAQDPTMPLMPGLYINGTTSVRNVDVLNLDAPAPPVSAIAAQPPAPAEVWEPRFNKPGDHAENKETEVKEGWIFRWAKNSWPTGFAGAGFRDGAIRAEFRWPTNGVLPEYSNEILDLRLKNAQETDCRYELRRVRDGVKLTWSDNKLRDTQSATEVAVFKSPASQPGEAYTMELRIVGLTITAKLNGQEIIRVEDRLSRADDPARPIQPVVRFKDSGVRNIEVLNLSNSTRESQPLVKAAVSTPSPSPVAVLVPESKPLSSPQVERWEPKLHRLEDHPATGDSELREGWAARKIDSPSHTRELGTPMGNGAVRAEFRWPASGNTGNLSLSNGGKGYSLERDRRGVSLRIEKIEVGRFEVPNPTPDTAYKMELRMSGHFVTGYLDGREVVRVEDDLRMDNATIFVTPAIFLHDALVRNIEILTLTPAGPRPGQK